ncbi:hypothetical protein COV19_01885 [Candidatus Woesearchaeota archaeon CG10_big_fil_rev_8_21_14_0_10_44_13]|nr:MAG: hypothetical protein COV19_01885 [Candidatus Woesearchaeota archaeon CG10_big_fil_rev_8_21_14_0_10_44_13]
MKKILSIICLFLAAMLLVTACKKADVEQPSMGDITGNEIKEIEKTPAESRQDIKVPADTYKILSTDSPGAIEFRYTVNNEDSAQIDFATFTIKNFGSNPIKPVVIFYIGGGSQGDMKRFDYDELPAGYKMIKTESIDMRIEDPVRPALIKAILRDAIKNNEDIAQKEMSYLAK